MTRPSRSSLVLDGSEVKYRLEAERLASKTPVHVDWVRFTVLRRNAPFVPVDLLFPHPDTNIWDENYRAAQQARVLRDIPDCDFDAATQALDLAQTVVTA
ncbi:MAG: replication initiation factor domain-containing protein, partial [Polaromonas sp.]|nr:replication initiation factor domain-containing protein [Polaromonas sp.]